MIVARGTVLAAMVVAAAVPAGAEVSFQNAWLRAPAPGQTVVAGYCDIVNAARSPATIVGFRDANCQGDDCAIRVEMHETTEQDGVLRMRPLRQLVIAGDGALSLVPGGKHLMVFGLASEARQVHLRAVFADGAEQVARFVVRPLGHDR